MEEAPDVAKARESRQSRAQMHPLRMLVRRSTDSVLSCAVVPQEEEERVVPATIVEVTEPSGTSSEANPSVDTYPVTGSQAQLSRSSEYTRSAAIKSLRSIREQSVELNRSQDSSNLDFVAVHHVDKENKRQKLTWPHLLSEEGQKEVQPQSPVSVNGPLCEQRPLAPLREANERADATPPQRKPSRSPHRSRAHPTKQLVRQQSLLKMAEQELQTNRLVSAEVSLGKRVGFYKFVDDIGRGNFASVKLAVHVITKEKVAVKITDKTKIDGKTRRILSKEIECMEKLHHPNIIRLYELIETVTKIYAVLEYGSGGELQSCVRRQGRLEEPLAKKIFAQLVAAVDHMHRQDVVHRDIKAENVFLVQNNIIKLGDFGFSCICRPDQTLRVFCGSPPYAAPELYQNKEYHGRLVDVWSMGILLFFIVTGRLPFRADTIGKLKKQIFAVDYSLPSFLTDDCCTLIKNILQFEPSKRATLPLIRRSPWLHDQSFPSEHQPYQLNPPLNGQNITDEERRVADILRRDMGVTDEEFQDGLRKQSRSSVTGTYRILLHRMHRNSVHNQSTSRGTSSTSSVGSQVRDAADDVSPARHPPAANWFASLQPSPVCQPSPASPDTAAFGLPQHRPATPRANVVTAAQSPPSPPSTPSRPSPSDPPYLTTHTQRAATPPASLKRNTHHTKLLTDKANIVRPILTNGCFCTGGKSSLCSIL